MPNINRIFERFDLDQYFVAKLSGADLKASKLNVVIPGFHDMNHRFEQFDMAFQKATTERRLKAKELTFI